MVPMVDLVVCLILNYEQGHQIICGDCRSRGNQVGPESPESFYEVSILGSGNSEHSRYLTLSDSLDFLFFIFL